jgi:hypothetical protein
LLVNLSQSPQRRREREEGFIDDRTLALSGGGGNVDHPHDVPRTTHRHGSETSSWRSLHLCELSDKFTRNSQHFRRKPSDCRLGSAANPRR